MDIQDLGAIGEIVGGMAVLITLVYLGIQTRTNTRALRAQTHQQITESRRQTLILFFEYPELHDAVNRAHAGEELSEQDRKLLRHYTTIVGRVHENELYQFSQGMIDLDEMESQRKVMLMPHIQFDMIEQSADVNTPAMREEIQLLKKRRNQAAVKEKPRDA